MRTLIALLLVTSLSASFPMMIVFAQITPPPPSPQQTPQPQSTTEPQLVPGEQVLWRRELTKGIFRKQIIETQMVTNRAIRVNQQALDL
jgi:hypothetical protein